ncbi:MAG: hypothetical protein HUJ22_11615 [Gracilimonas sp.]|uniref:hypothetical protein n=1 Tax=Gracilimonas sp. TaxID=1974203 RepID=UPI0019A0756E|nr:hypothetical protein [Gracilimonas sp.]MBD3617207.1 hypothetical protein [Gracilimonas sp.]
MMRTRPLLFLLFAFLIPVLATAQGGQAGGDNSLLPEINPQDIEIRSEFKARFPGLRRQPILGFNPKPRVFQIDPNRMPFMETPEEAVADISITELGRPEPPYRTKMNTPERMNGYVRAGFGSFLTPEINGYGFYELSEQSLVSGNLNMRASDGHLDTQESGFRYLDVNGTYVTEVKEGLKLSVDVGALSDYNYLFDLSDNIQQNIGETSDKDYTGLSGQLSLQKMKNTLTGWDFTAGGSVFASSLNAGASNFSGNLDEQVLHSSFSYYWPGQKMYETFKVSGSVAGGNYNSSFFDAQSWINARASVTYERLFNFTTRVKATGGIEYISDSFSNKIYAAPEIEVKHHLNEKLSVSGTAFARPELQTMQEHHQSNRFLNMQIQLQHAYDVGASGEVNFQLFDGNRLFGGINYTHTNDYAYYTREEVLPTNDYGFYNVNYGDANIFELYFGASQQLVPEKFWADVKLYARSPNLKNGGEIPYEEKLGIKGAVSFRPLKELTINGWTEYIGSRESPETNTTLDAFLLLNAGAEYQINETFGVYAKLLNLMGQEYEIWNGYQERPLQIFGGLTIKF